MGLQYNDGLVEAGNCSDNSDIGAKNFRRVAITNGSYSRKMVRCSPNNC